MEDEKTRPFKIITTVDLSKHAILDTFSPSGREKNDLLLPKLKNSKK